jgi:hypothetical protein
MRKGSLVIGLASAVLLGTSAAAQSPDVIVYDIGVDGGNINDIHYYGQAGGIAAYSFATQSCNRGTAVLDWYDAGGDVRHPVIAQNMFRLKDGRFEQIGQSWLKHGFCAVNETEAFCGPCQSTSCDTLGIGCADTYWATLNDGASGRSKRFVNAADGTHVDGTSGPTGLAAIRGRLQVAVVDIDPAQNPGAEYFIEGQYVTADDHQAGNALNNCSYRPLTVNSVNSVSGGGPTVRELSALYAWQDADRDVVLRRGISIEVGGLKSYFMVGARVRPNGGGSWHYEYAVHNLTSDRSGASFSVPIGAGANITNIGFHDVDYHSGDPYDGTDWSSTVAGGTVTWSTTDFATDPNANALRWGTMYNFWFDADLPPDPETVVIGLFKPGTPTGTNVDNVPAPTGTPFDKWVTAGAPTGTGSVFVPLVVSNPGSGVNPNVLGERTPAVPGEVWEGLVSLGGVERAVLLVSPRSAEGEATAFGELLVEAPVTARVQGLSFAIPDDPALAGSTFTVQAAVRRAGRWELTNALEVTIGSQR